MPASEADETVVVCLIRRVSNGGSASAKRFAQRDMSDESACRRLIFRAGISHGREVVGHGGRNVSNWLASNVPANLACQGQRWNEDFMSTQPNPITPHERPQSVREAPVSQEYAARFLNMHPKTVLRKAREGSLPAHPIRSRPEALALLSLGTG